MNKFLLFITFILAATLLKSQTPTASFSTWKDNKKAAYTIIHDDFSNYVTGIFKYADTIAYHRQIKLCFGVITNPIDCGPTEWAQARTMMEHGHECINHTHNHLCGGSASECSGLDTYGPSQFDTELGLSTQLIEANTGVRPIFFIHPYDAPSAAIENYLIGAGYIGARGGTQSIYNTNAFSDYMHLNYYVWGPKSAQTSLNKELDQTIAVGGYAVREFHGLEDKSYGAMKVPNYIAHLDYVKSQVDNGNLWSATASEAITYKMQRDAYQPNIDYNAFNGQINVNFSKIQDINTAILRTPVTVNVNLNAISNPYTVSQNGAPIAFTRNGNIVSFNVYPHQGNVVLNCANCITISNATNLTATPQPNAASINWTNIYESFSDVMVVVKEASGFTTKPIGTTYTASSDFLGNGAPFEGGKVVYQGAGTNVYVTNLSGGKTYTVRLYVRSNTDWSSGVETTVTIPNVPVANVTNLRATPQTPTLATANWTNIGAFNDVLVVVKQGSGFTTKPANVSYTSDANFMGAGASFEGGKVVYQGTGTNLDITSLTALQTYFIRVYVRNGPDWSTGIETSVTMPAPPVPNVTNLVGTPQSKSATATWTNPTTTFNDVLVVVKQGSGFTTRPTSTTYAFDANFIGTGAPFEGGKVVYQGTGANLKVTNLTPEQTYFIRVYVRDSTYWSAGVETVITVPAISLVGCLQASYFNNITLSDKPIFVRYESSIDYKWDTIAPAPGVKIDSFSVRWEGSFTAPTSGLYEFTTKTNAGVRLWVDNVTLVNHWGAQSLAPLTGTITLVQGSVYPIKMEYFDGSGKASTRLRWTLPATTKKVNMPFSNCAALASAVRLGATSLDKDRIALTDSDDDDIQIVRGNNPSSPYSFNIFPNPTKDRVAIDLSECEGKMVDISIINFLGREVYNEKISAAPFAPHSIDISTLTGGEYMIRIATEDKNATIKKLTVVH